MQFIEGFIGIKFFLSKRFAEINLRKTRQLFEMSLHEVG